MALSGNERISSDRLFRVRAHQPFNSSGKIIMSQCDNSKLPTVKNSVCLGDICIFAKPAEENCVPWATGKITQFAFYKQKSKRDQQHKKSDAAVESPVGVPCSWFKQCGNKFLLLAELCRKSMQIISLCSSLIYVHSVFILGFLLWG